MSAVFLIFSQIKALEQSNANSLVTGNVLSDLTEDDSLRSARIKVLKVLGTCYAVISKNNPP